MDGVVIVDKPSGMSSHDVVRRVRRALGGLKIGHTGTLDPNATGVLPLVVGEATKLARYLLCSEKSYLATIRLGQTTDTLDADGQVLVEQPVVPQPERLAAVVAGWLGEQIQVPPMYSAIKHEGQRLYQLARAGQEVDRPGRTIRIEAADIVQVSWPDVQVRLRCSAGTYVRVLAAQLGEALGCGGHLLALRRLQAGPFTLEQAVPLCQIEQDPSLLQQHLLTMGQMMAAFPTLPIPAGLGQRIRQGYQLNVGDLRQLLNVLPSFAAQDILVLQEGNGSLVAVARACIGKDALSQYRRERPGLRTERVLLANSAP